MTYRLPVAKDPDEVLDYPSSWEKLLVDGDTLETVVYTLPGQTGLVIDSSSNDTTHSTVWLSGGVLGTTYRIDVIANTTLGRRFNRTLELQIRAK